MTTWDNHGQEPTQSFGIVHDSVSYTSDNVWLSITYEDPYIDFFPDDALTAPFGSSSVELPSWLPDWGITHIKFRSEELSPGVTQEYRLIGQMQVTAVPVPAAVWLFGSALVGLVGIRRRQSK